MVCMAAEITLITVCSVVSFRVLQQDTMVAGVAHTVLDASHSLSHFPLIISAWSFLLSFQSCTGFFLIHRFVVCCERYFISLNSICNSSWCESWSSSLASVPLVMGFGCVVRYPANFLIVKCKKCFIITFSYTYKMWFHHIYPSIIHFLLFPFFHIPISLCTFMLSF